jgi:serine/threonine protein kinase
MQADKWTDLKALFHKALELPPEKRAEYLQQACAGNDSLRLAAESLIRAHEKSSSFLDGPAYEATTHLFASSPDLKPGDRIAHYEIRGLLGSGGMGKVYRAEDTKLKRDVALKVLAVETGEQDAARKRFLREARAAAALDHPHICAIYEVGEDKRNSYIAMQLIAGETLESRLRQSGMSLSEVLTIAIQIADALTTAHAQEIIHRDIKPANLILTTRGDVKILDFGLAKVKATALESLSQAETTLLTHPGLLVGTVPYMSPEQTRGQEVDARSDIWSLGILLYQMVARHTPFAEQSNTDTLAAILTREPLPLTNLSAEIPAGLQLIVGKMLRKDREERYQTAKEVLIDLQALHKQLSTGPTPSTGPRVKQITGHPSVKTTSGGPAKQVTKYKWLAASLALLLLAASAFVLWRVPRTQPASDKPRLQGAVQVTTWSGLDIHPSLSPDANAIAYSSDHGGNFEIYVKPMTPGGRETQITNDGQANFEPAWSPDGRWITYSSKNRGGIWIVPSAGGNAKQVSQFGSHPVWSPDGTLLAFQSDPITALGAQAAPSQPPSLIYVVPADGRGDPSALTQLGHPAGGHGAPAWSPDSKHLAICVSDFGSTSIWIISRDGSAQKQAVPDGFDPVYGPDGKSLYYTRLNGIWKTQLSPETGEPTGEPIQLNTSASERIRGFTISADGKKIVYAALLTNSNLWYVPISPATSAPTGNPISLTHDREFRNSVPVFSPDGQKLAFNTQKSSRARAEGDIWIMDRDGQNATQITTDGGGLASWFPGARELAFLSYREPRHVWLADLQTGRDKTLSLDFGEDVNYMRLSPDGKEVLFNSKRSGTTNVWKIPIEGGQPKQLTFDNELIGFACWSPDGKTIGVQLKRQGDTHVGVMPSDGGPITQLTFSQGQSWLSGFSPDGDKLVFAGFRDGLWNIWWVSRSTKEQKKLTNYTRVNAFVRYPAWSPLGNQIAYEYAETTGNIWVAELK